MCRLILVPFHTKTPEEPEEKLIEVFLFINIMFLVHDGMYLCSNVPQ